MTNDFINNLRQKVDSNAAYIFYAIKHNNLGYTLEDNPNDHTIYSFKNVKDDANIIINIMIFTEEQGDPKESNNILYDSSISSLIKTDYYIMDKGVSRIRVIYDGFIDLSPADAILELQVIVKYITELVSEIVYAL